MIMALQGMPPLPEKDLWTVNGSLDRPNKSSASDHPFAVKCSITFFFKCPPSSYVLLSYHKKRRRGMLCIETKFQAKTNLACWLKRLINAGSRAEGTSSLLPSNHRTRGRSVIGLRLTRPFRDSGGPPQ